MENIIKTELLKNSRLVVKKACEKNVCDLSPSYKMAMDNALSFFEEKGLPSKKDEDWKYTNIAKNLSHYFYEQKESIIHDVPTEVLDQRGMIIFNNGIFNKFLSVLPIGIEIDALEIKDLFFDAFDSLNYGVAFSALALKIKKNTVLDFPITIVHLVDEAAVNKMVSPRLTIKAEAFSKVSFLEIFISSKKEILQYSTNAVTHFILNENASLEHVLIQTEAKNAVHIGLTVADVFKGSHFQSMTLDFGLLIARHNLCINLREAGSEASVHGLFTLDKSDHVDIFSTIIHHAPHTTSSQLFKGILSGDSHGVFTGKIIVKKDAQQSNSSQLNKNLLLSKKAHIDTRPQLMVHADDVKCSHGATIGQLSQDEEFYLETRGIPKERAKQILCHGFATEVLHLITNPLIKSFAENMLILNFEKSAINGKKI